MADKEEEKVWVGTKEIEWTITHPSVCLALSLRLAVLFFLLFEGRHEEEKEEDVPSRDRKASLSGLWGRKEEKDATES